VAEPYKNVSNESGWGLPPAGSEPGEGFVATTSLGTPEQIVGGRPLTMQEKYERFILPKERDRLSTFLADRAAAQQNQQVAQSGRNDELSRRLGIAGTAQGAALGSALSSSSQEAQARSSERARAQFDEDIQGFRASELNRLATPRQKVSDADIFGKIFQKVMEIIGGGARAAAGGGGGGGAFIPKIDAPNYPAPDNGFVEGARFVNAGAGDASVDTLSGAFGQRASGGGIGRMESEEERQRRMGLA
jgi:hypothetical protein